MSLACPNCGSSPDTEDVYCGTCGHPVKVHAAQTAELASASARDRTQVGRDVPEPRRARDAGWDNWTAQATAIPRPRPARSGPAPEAPGPARGSGRSADGLAAAASGDARVHVSGPRDRAESGVAAADPQSYITADDRRLSYADLGVSATLDPLANGRFFWQLARRFALYFVVANLISIALFVLAFLVTLLDGGTAGLANGGGAFRAVTIIDLLITAALMAMFFFMPVPALLGQWSRMLTFQAPAAGPALDRVRQALDRHATPHDTLGLRALSPPGEGRRDYLEVRRGYFAGYVSCFPHGHDLYVGWTFWIYISPFRLFLVRIGRRFQDYTGRGNDMYQTLRYEPARATIAALHSCTLEGVDIATGGTPPPHGRDETR